MTRREGAVVIERTFGFSITELRSRVNGIQQIIYLRYLPYQGSVGIGRAEAEHAPPHIRFQGDMYIYVVTDCYSNRISLHQPCRVPGPHKRSTILLAIN